MQRAPRLAKDLLDVAAVPTAVVERLLAVAEDLKNKPKRTT